MSNKLKGNIKKERSYFPPMPLVPNNVNTNSMDPLVHLKYRTFSFDGMMNATTPVCSLLLLLKLFLLS